MKVYVASSWRNHRQPRVVAKLREEGHEVYDFREPTSGDVGFSWNQLDPSLPVGPADLQLPAATICEMLDHPAAEAGFASDMAALEWCDALVLLLPSGRSAHLEAGWAAGARKLTVALIDDGEPELMWKMLDHLCSDEQQIVEVLRVRR